MAVAENLTADSCVGSHGFGPSGVFRTVFPIKLQPLRGPQHHRIQPNTADFRPQGRQSASQRAATVLSSVVPWTGEIACVVKAGERHMLRGLLVRALVLGTALLLLSQGAQAHTGAGVAGGFWSGVLHPITGWDHVIAMVAVGLWGAFLGRPAIWVLPVVFPLVMAFGGALGVLGVPLPHVEVGIALSAVVLGLMVATAARLPLLWAGVIVGIFAIFHGHAHGTELPGAANPFAYALGFVIATGCLHVLGITFGLLTKWKEGRIAVRTGGMAIAVTGLAFLTGWL